MLFRLNLANCKDSFNHTMTNIKDLYDDTNKIYESIS